MNTSSLTVDIFPGDGNWTLCQTGSDNSTIDNEHQDLVRRFSMSLFTSFVWGAQIALACTSLLFNYFLLNALTKVKKADLKAKSFIQSNAIANIILPLSFGIKLEKIAIILNVSDRGVLSCLGATHSVFYSVALYIQATCSLGLACDRLYAVISPLNYYTTGYNAVVRVFMVISPALVALLIKIGFIVNSVLSDITVLPGYHSICIILGHASMLQRTSRLIEYYLLFIYTLSLFIYIVIFVIWRYQRQRMKKLSDTAMQREGIALTVTYFLTNVFTLLLYVPAPLLSIVYRLRQISPESPSYVPLTRAMLVLSGIYTINCFLAPFILCYRIPKIRQHLSFDWNLFGKSRPIKSVEVTASRSETGETQTRKSLT